MQNRKDSVGCSERSNEFWNWDLWLVIIGKRVCCSSVQHTQRKAWVVGWQAELSLGEEKYCILRSTKSGSIILHFVRRLKAEF